MTQIGDYVRFWIIIWLQFAIFVSVSIYNSQLCDLQVLEKCGRNVWVWLLAAAWGAVSQVCSVQYCMQRCAAAGFWQDLPGSDLQSRTRMRGAGGAVTSQQLVPISREWMRWNYLESFLRTFSSQCYSCHGIFVADIIKCAGSPLSSVGLSLRRHQEDEWQWEWHRESWWSPPAQSGVRRTGSGIPATKPRVQGAAPEEDWESPAAE